MVSKNEKSPDNSKKPDNGMQKRGEEEVMAGKSSLLQVPVKRASDEDNPNLADTDSLQKENNKRNTKNIILEVSGIQRTPQKRKYPYWVKHSAGRENTEKENTDLTDMKIKIETLKTKPVLETVQFNSFPPETQKIIDPETTYLEKNSDPEKKLSGSSQVALEPKSPVSPETAPEKKVELIPETKKKGIFPPEIRPQAQKTKIKKKSRFLGKMKDLTRDIAGIKESEKLSDKLKEFFDEVKTPGGAKKKFAEVVQSLKDEELRVLPPYDPVTCGPLLEYEIPSGFTEIERYWVEEPYAFISIIENLEMKYYYVVEPTLSTYEKAVLERVRDNLEDMLTQDDMISGQDKDVILINRGMRLLDQYYSTLEVSSIHKIMYFLRRNFIGYERINALIRDPNIEDISCSGIEIPIYLYHMKHNNIVTNILFGEKEVDSLVVKLCQRSGKHISIGEPIVDATLPDGSRIQATLGKEVTTRGSSFTIRKFNGDPITPIDLIRYGTCSIEMMAYYWIAIENNISVLFAGGTASGKTSLMNAISLLIPRLSKVVSIEDTREIMLHHENWIAGATRKSFTVGGTGEVSMYELLKAALRQRPEYILVGEVRGKEALTLFQAMSTGHTTYSTMHASDVQTVINRLENEPINVPHVMMQALGVICIQMQTYVNETRVRRTKTIVEITGLDARSGSLRINELYRWEPVHDNFKRAGDSYVLNEIMKARGWNPDKLFIEFKNREQILAYLTAKQIRDYVSVSLIVHMYATNPQLVMEAVGNDTLQDMVMHHS
ncbi:Flagella-related protein FlaI [Methanosarcina siciliae HI350]|uniref:Flagella-related protein FlaI n=2 Tax=Methanosarcina siciliae TaxID=38027 RepID=A0A0E3LBK6_9EURY|nr:type II/IV secretion system ATPase subunit [Methanosarcina siciliae]AKB33936.1 Flagella-related protein FlaI [Methanosarcina siciliae HI350]